MRLKSDHLREAHVVVVGAGAIGAATSYRLAQAGASVTTVERRYPGSGTTGSSFAWLNGFEKFPKDYHRLNLTSIRDHENLADELDGDWVHVDGGLHWAQEGDPARLGKLRENVRRLREWGLRVDKTTPEIAMREVEPDLWIDPATVPEVYFIAREGWLDSVAMAHRVMHAAVLRYGAILLRGAVVDLRLSGRAVRSVVLDDGRELAADVVVNAAGPEARQIGALAGIPVSVDRRIGMVLSTAPAPVCLKSVLHAPEGNVRPDGGGRLQIRRPNMDDEAREGQPTSLDAPVIREALREVGKVLPCLLDIPAEAVRIGVRPMPRDGLSIVGFEPAIENLYTVVTHSGITLAARLALLVAEDLAGGDVPELAPYRPSRFAGSA